MFTKDDVAEYYNNTLSHYERWWNLEKGLSLHYGIWTKNTKSFAEALINTNRVLMELAEISETDKILDAGCGVGGAAIFLNEQKNCRVTGITLSQKQMLFANRISTKKNVGDKVTFKVMDYTKTTFPDASFDVIWACESISSAPDKLLFIKEAYRLLKKGGRLILSDFFLTDANQQDSNSWIKKWGETWGISNFVTCDFFIENLTKEGFVSVKSIDYTTEIQKSAKRLYYSAILGAIPSELYNLLNSNVTRFAGNHYKCGYFQYKALKGNLWKYNVIIAVKG